MSSCARKQRSLRQSRVIRHFSKTVQKSDPSLAASFALNFASKSAVERPESSSARMHSSLSKLRIARHFSKAVPKSSGFFVGSVFFTTTGSTFFVGSAFGSSGLGSSCFGSVFGLSPSSFGTIFARKSSYERPLFSAAARSEERRVGKGRR